MADVDQAVGLGREDLDHAIDAIESALESLYRLTEGLKLRSRKAATTTPFERAESGDVAGETTFGLVYARGHNTHRLMELYDEYTFGSHGFGQGPFGGGWGWVRDDQPDTRFPLGARWYSDHVAGHAIAPPFRVAIAWLDE
jgi:hypothetical protein